MVYMDKGSESEQYCERHGNPAVPAGSHKPVRSLLLLHPAPAPLKRLPVNLIFFQSRLLRHPWNMGSPSVGASPAPAFPRQTHQKIQISGACGNNAVPTRKVPYPCSAMLNGVKNGGAQASNESLESPSHTRRQGCNLSHSKRE